MHMCSLSDATCMNIEVHESTGSCLYELVFEQKPRAVLFPSGKNSSAPLLEEDLEKDGIRIVGFEEEEMVYRDDVLQVECKPEDRDRKRQWDEDGSKEEGEAATKKRRLQDGDQETSSWESNEDIMRTKSLATTKKHLKVSMSILYSRYSSVLRGVLNAVETAS